MPEAGASISLTDLSLSSEYSGCPCCTCAPSCTSHSARVPSSMEKPSLGSSIGVLMMSDHPRSQLGGRQVDFESIERRLDFDLAQEAARGASVQYALEQGDLLVFRRCHSIAPVCLQITMACAASQAPATIRQDARHLMVERSLHERVPRLRLDDMSGTVVLDERDSDRHVSRKESTRAFQ